MKKIFKQARSDQIAEIIRRAIPKEQRTGEIKLIIAIMEQAIFDGIRGDRVARIYMTSELCKQRCEAAGLNFNFVRDLVKHHAWRSFKSKGIINDSKRTFANTDCAGG